MTNPVLKPKHPVGARRSPYITYRIIIAILIALPYHLLVADRAQASSGDLDPRFGNMGKVATDFGINTRPFAVATLLYGKIIVVGSTIFNGREQDFALARYDINGSIDTSFGTGGRVITDFFGELDSARSAVALPDGKVVVGGFSSRGRLSSDPDFGLARYNVDGSLDASFGAGGKVTTDFFNNSDSIETIALQPDGKIIAAGSAFRFDNNSGIEFSFALARYHSNGDLDLSFGSGGKVTTGFATFVNSLAIQPDGKIVAAGFDGANFALARYNTDGSLDPGFGTGGTVITSFTDIFSGRASALSLALQPDGKIIAAGMVNVLPAPIGFGEHFALARYDSGGKLDPGFGIGGKVITDFSNSDDVATDIVLQPDGKVIAVGGTYDYGRRHRDFALARYDASGNLDAGFGMGGKLTTDFFGADDYAIAVALQRDGQLIVAGSSMTSDRAGLNFSLARYNIGLASDSLFDLCLQDDGTGDTLELNLNTGDYMFTECGTGGSTLGGVATIKFKGCKIEIKKKANGRKVVIKIDTCLNSGTASIKVSSPKSSFTITDANTTNNTCACR